VGALLALAAAPALAGASVVRSAAEADAVVRIAMPREMPEGTTFRGVVIAAPGSSAYAPDFLLTTDRNVLATGPILPGLAVRFTGSPPQAVWTAAGDTNTGRYGVSAAFIDDIDGDGAADVAVGAFGLGIVSLVSGASGAPLGDLTTTPTEFASFGFSLATVRGPDGDQRLLVSSPGPGVARGYATDDLGAPPTLFTLGDGPTPSFAQWLANLGDINGDGYDDFVATEPDFTFGAYVFSGQTGEIIRTHLVRNLSVNRSAAAAGDLDGDGVGDVLVAGANRLRAYSGATGEAIFNLRFDDTDALRSALSVGDVTGDGVPDFVMAEPLAPGAPGTAGAPGPDGALNVGRVTLYCGRTRTPIVAYVGGSAFDAFGASMDVMGASPETPAALLVRAFRSTGGVEGNGAYAFVFRLPTPCPGDATFDGAVGFADIALVLSQMGQQGALTGDLNADGVVDFQDLSIVLGAFGTTCD